MGKAVKSKKRMAGGSSSIHLPKKAAASILLSTLRGALPLEFQNVSISVAVDATEMLLICPKSVLEAIARR